MVRKTLFLTERMLNEALGQLALHGLLLKSDPKLPSVITLVAGEPVRGSWWGHPMGNQMFHLLESLEDHEDAALVKLVSGKDTFVHKRLFSHLASIGMSREDWQLNDLTAAAARLLELVDKEGIVRTENLRLPGLSQSTKIGEAARELERVLLVRSENVHTPSGKHAKVLESWQRWLKRMGVREKTAAKDAKREIEEIVESLNRRYQGRGRLPWPATPG